MARFRGSHESGFVHPERTSARWREGRKVSWKRRERRRSRRNNRTMHITTNGYTSKFVERTDRWTGKWTEDRMARRRINRKGGKINVVARNTSGDERAAGCSNISKHKMARGGRGRSSIALTSRVDRRFYRYATQWRRDTFAARNVAASTIRWCLVADSTV